MPVDILDNQPKYVAKELANLRQALDAPANSGGIPPKTAGFLLIATWNIRHFGGLTPKWKASQNDSPKRDVRSCLFIAEILSRFDVIALQEIKQETTALRQVLRWLNQHQAERWRILATDITKGSTGNNERLGYLYDSQTVTATGLAAELVVPPNHADLGITGDALQDQFARTPYAASFRHHTHSFILNTLHVLYGGSEKSARQRELSAIARWLDDWARQEHIWDDADLLALGDFNIDRKNDPRWQAFVSTHLTVPTELNDVPRSIFLDPNTPATNDKFYDQIAWFTGQNGSPNIRMHYTGLGGNFDFVAHVLGDLNKNSMSYRMSDHYPLWVQFSCP